MKADLILLAPTLVTCGPSDQPRCGASMRDLSIVENGALVIQGETIVAVGPLDEIRSAWEGEEHSYPGCLVPGLVDPHCHPVFAGSRANEFVMRAQGATYQQIHEAGGGIFSTVRASCAASDAELEALARERVLRMLAHGTTTLEAKSGYGLSTAEELRHLRVIKNLLTPVELVPTFLGAHAIPPEVAREDFVELLCVEMIPAVAAEKLAEFGDVFCEQGAFTCEESRRILQCCKDHGMKLRIHAEEFTYQGGARMAAELGAASADHLQFLPESDFPILKAAGTIPVMTAGTSFFLGMTQYAPARGLIAAGLPLAIGSDFNAGSNLSESMQMAMSLAVLQLKLTPEEALIAATVNSAHSLGRAHRVGSLEVGKQADVLAVSVRDIREWPYHYGVNLVQSVYKKGKKL